MTIIPRDGNRDKARKYLMLAGLDASAVSGSLQEYLLSSTGKPVTSVSAVKAMKTASEQGVPLYRITPSNSAAVIPGLQLADSVKDTLTNEAAAGLTHVAAARNVSLDAWTGTGFEAVDPSSGNNYANLSGPPNVIQGLSWPARSILLLLSSVNAEPPAAIASAVITDDFTSNLAGVSSGLSALSGQPASANLDLLTSVLFSRGLSDELGCYADLSTPAAPTGACMASYLGLLCSAMGVPIIADKNNKPVADAGDEKLAGLNETVILDGNRSYDPDSDPLTYQWSFTSVPRGSSATISGAGTVSPSFSPDVAGAYTVELIVSDGKKSSDPDTVTIIAAPAIVTVPSVVGLGREDAEGVIRSAGLSVGLITAGTDSTIAAGRIKGQSPSAGIAIDRGSSVGLVVSTGLGADTEPPLVTVSFDRTPALYTSGAQVHVTISATDTIGVSSISMTVDGGPVNVTLPVTTIDTTGYAAGSSHTVVVTSKDISLNTTMGTASFGILDPTDKAAPLVSIATPTIDAAVTAPIDIIGSVSDSNLFEYTLAYSPVGKNAYTVFARGSHQVSNGVLGRLDPTLMQNGIYDILLTAVDANGNAVAYVTRYGVSGDLKVGNFTVTFTDLSIPVTGIPITVSRTYDSREKNSKDFGYGWSVDIQNTKTDENRTPGTGWPQAKSGGAFGTYCINGDTEHYVSVNLPDNRTEEFDMVLTPNCQRLAPIDQTAVSYTPRPGTTSTLALKSSPLLLVVNGQLIDPDTIEPFDPSAYVLTTADGTMYDLDQNFGVRKITDTNGNIITYGANGITHSAGLGVTFARDSTGRITRITAPDNKTITYAYDANGNLASITDLARNVTTYTYNTTHGLVDVIDPLGRRAVRNEYDTSGRLTAHIDADGKRIEYTHDIAGRQEVVKDRNGNLTVYIYDNNGRVLQKTDPMGHTSSFAYDVVGNKTSETDPLGNTTRWTYDTKKNVLTEARVVSNQTFTTSRTYNSLGKVLTTTDPLGHVTTNTYDTKGNLLTTTDALGNVTTNTYDAKGNLKTVTDALNNTTTYEYDGYGNRKKQTTALGAVTTYDYDTKGNKLSETDPRSNTTTYTYDANGKLLTVTNAEGAVTKYGYDKVGNKISETNPLGLITWYYYDSANRLMATEYPDGTATQTQYDNEGNRIASIDQEGRTTTYEYNASKQLIKTTYADNTTRTFGYDSAGRQTTTTDAQSNTTTKVYDALGRVNSSIDPENNTTSFEFDANGNQVKQIDPNGHATTFAYDENNRLITTTLPGGQATSVGYDALGRKASETDAAGSKTQFDYDAAGNLVKVTDAESGITQYEYDQNNNRTAIIDARGNRTTSVFDNLNRPVSKTMPNNGTETYVYDKAGRQTAKIDAKGQKIVYSYDDNSRLVTRTYPDASTVRFSYTNTGKRLSVTDKRGTTNYAYDGMNRLKTNTYPDGNAINYGYDATGKLAALSSSLTGTVTYTYYNSGRLKEVKDPQDHITSYTYDAAGSRTGLAYPNGTTVSYAYDTNNRLTNLTHRNGLAEVMASYAYTLGSTGNRTRIDEANGISRQYQSDRLYRLRQEKVIDLSNAQTYQNDYIYDAVGNRLNKTYIAYNQPVMLNDYTYNNADQLITENSITYTYDLNGNLATKTTSTGTTTYVYNYDDRLVEVQMPNAPTVKYQYDADNNRVNASTASGTTKYLVDTNHSLAQVLAEYSTMGAVAAFYVYADDLISINRGGVVSYYHFDGLGSTRLLTDPSGVVTDMYDYDAFGNQIARTGTTVNDFLFTGQQYNANIGFYYLRARYYQPDTGRFAACDSYQGDPYAPHTLHKYQYTNSNPINAIDPTGNFDMGETLTAITLSTIVSNIAISMIAFNTMADSGFKIDAILVSGRVDMSISGGAAGGGADVLIDFKTKKIYGSLAGEGGLDPLSVFNKHGGLGGTAVAGLVFSLSNPNQLSGWGVSAFWPISVMKLMPIVGGSSNVWGMMTQFAKKVTNQNGFSIGFGQSTSGPAMMFFGPSYRMFSSMVSYNTNFIPVEQMLPGAQSYLSQLSDTVGALSSLGNDMSTFSGNADKALSLLQ